MTNKYNIIRSGEIYHIYNRGVEKRTIFYTEQDFNYFLERILFYRDVIGIKLLCYSIMPNHYHFVLKEPINPTLRVRHPKGGVMYKPNINHFKGTSIAKFMGLLANSYTKYFNYKYDHSGRIFQGPFRSKLIHDDAYLEKIISYVNLNPLKHNIVDNIKDWQYTSHHDYIDKKRLRLIDGESLIDFNEYGENLKFYTKELKEIEYEFKHP